MESEKNNIKITGREIFISFLLISWLLLAVSGLIDALKIPSVGADQADRTSRILGSLLFIIIPIYGFAKWTNGIKRALFGKDNRERIKAIIVLVACLAVVVLLFPTQESRIIF